MEHHQTHVIEQVLESTRRRLLDLGTRNRLVHVNRANQRSNSLNIINERSEDVLRILRSGSQKKMRFKAMGKDRGADDEDDLLLAVSDDAMDEGSNRFTDQILETPLGPEGLARRLLRLSAAARIAEEEQGLNILYLAMGFLQWKESESSDVVREAPLLLLPVELVRNQRTSTFDIRLRDDDLSTNLPLRERLSQDEGIVLPDVRDDEDLSPEQYFDEVSDAIGAKPSWNIDRNGMQLGFFSFAKLLMHRDLDPAVWDSDTFAENDLLIGLLTEGFDVEEPIFGPDDKLDKHLDPAQIIQVVDADASQTKVIEEVRRGASMVVQGPPGTGKSQTIANIIAGAVHDGKTVLFVAEKMAALSVVHSRLVKVGLRDVCLELHSRTANKKAVLTELRRSLAASTAVIAEQPDIDRLRRSRDELNDIADLLHMPTGKSGDTPFATLSTLVGYIGGRNAPPRIDRTDLDSFGPLERKQCTDAIKRFTQACAAIPSIERHPFKGVTQLDLQPTDLERLKLEITDALALIDAWRTDAVDLCDKLQCFRPATLAENGNLVRTIQLLQSMPDDPDNALDAMFEHCRNDRMVEGLQRGVAWREAYDTAKNAFVPEAFTMPTAAIRAGLLRGQTSFWGRVFGPYRGASKDLHALLSEPLPKQPELRLGLINNLAEVQEKRRVLSEDEDWLKRFLGDSWRGGSTPFAGLTELCRWTRQLLEVCPFETADDVRAALEVAAKDRGAADRLHRHGERVTSGVMAVFDRLDLNLEYAGFDPDFLHVDMVNVHDRMVAIQRNPDGYADWATLERTSDDATVMGASAIVNAVRQGRLLADNAVSEFLYACAEARWADVRQQHPQLNVISNKDRHALVHDFQTLDHARLEQGREDVLRRHYAQTPKGSAGQMGLIRGEIGKKRGHRPIRWLMTNAGAMVQRIKPVMLMSPLSVAQFLPPNSVDFDLLVIDEASQVRPEDALGVVARAKQIVVVGDTQQLPPTNFFSRLVEDTDDEDDDAPTIASAADMESVLSLCEARGLKPRMLEWHYRSKDPSLIRVSNAEFYEDRLVLPPSPLEKDENYGMKFRQVPGVYASAKSGLGRDGTNRIEAEHVVQAVADHARHWSNLSLGIVAFSKNQADMITEVLELARRTDPVLDALLREGKNEDVFVKNIENVQGDERDVIFVSVGYGPSEANGRLVNMRFGPVNREGGERRLNVLFSRSRVRCEIFASFDPGDIDIGRVQSVGPRVLKRFLEFAKTGIIEEAAPTGEGADSPFEEDVANEVRKLGYVVDYQVGSAGFRIDLGIRHEQRPSQYFLAIECDGATYHSALWARERDRLRQEILENLGWKFHRIWSTDWFHRREQEVGRLAHALRVAMLEIGDGITLDGTNEFSPEIAFEDPTKVSEEIDIDAIQISVPRYHRSQRSVNSSAEPHTVPIRNLANLVNLIIEDEGPIHMEEVARRVAAAFGKTKAGKRISDVTDSAFGEAIRMKNQFHQDGDFVMTCAQYKNPPVRDRSAEADGILKAEYLPPIEVLAAAELIEVENGAMAKDEMIKAIARVLGFKRTGPKLHEVLTEILNQRN